MTEAQSPSDRHRVHEGWADDLMRDTSRYRLLPDHGSASQIVDIKNPSQSADWGFTNVWPNSVTDIAALQLALIDSAAVEMMNRMRPLFGLGRSCLRPSGRPWCYWVNLETPHRKALQFQAI